MGLALLAAGCASEPDLRWIDSSGLGLEIAFVIEVDPEGSLRIGRPFGGGPDAFGKPTFETADPARTQYLVSFERRALTALAPAFDPSRLDELAVAMRDGEPLDPNGSPARVAVPEAARVHRLDLESGALEPFPRDTLTALSSLMLVVPTDPRFCQEGLEGLEPFGARPYLLSPSPFGGDNGPFHTIDHVIPLSRTRVLGASRQVLFVLDEGAEIAAPTSTAAARTILVGLLGLSVADFRALTLSPDRSTVWVAGTYEDEDYGFVARFRLDGATLTFEDLHLEDRDGARFPPLRGVTIDADDQVLVVGKNLWAALLAPGAAGFRRVPLPQPPSHGGSEDDGVLARATGDPEAPHLIGLRGDVALVGDATADRFEIEWIQHVDDRPFGVSPHLEDVAIGPDERWAAGRGAVLARWIRGPGWERVRLAETPRAYPCTLGLDLNATSMHFVSVAADADHVFVLADRCNAMLAIDRDLGCTAFVELPDEPAVQGETEPLRIVRLAYGRLWLAGERGRLFVLDRP